MSQDLEIQNTKPDTEPQNTENEMLNSSHTVPKVEEPNGCVRFLEEIRYYINRFLLWKPFYCLARINGIKDNLHFIFYDLSIFEMVYWLILLIFFYTTLDTALNDGLNDNAYRGLGALTGFFYTFTLLLGHRNSLTNFFFGLSLDRTVFFHQYLGRASITIGWIHGIAMHVHTKKGGIFKGFKGSMGTTANLVATLMAITAYWTIRRKNYELFLIPHGLLSFVFCIFAIIHGSNLIGLPLGIFIIDIFRRMWKLKRQVVDLVNLKIVTSKKNVVLIEFKNTIKFNSGDYLYTIIPAVDENQMHPFSISSIPSDSTEKLIF